MKRIYILFTSTRRYDIIIKNIKRIVIREMTDIILLIVGCSLALLFFIWLIFGRKISSKAATLLIDTGLLALCIAAIACSLRLRQEKYESISDAAITQANTQKNK